MRVWALVFALPLAHLASGPIRIKARAYLSLSCVTWTEFAGSKWLGVAIADIASRG